MNSVKALRALISENKFQNEYDSITTLLSLSQIDAEQRKNILDQSRAMVRACRQRSNEAGTLEKFLQQFGLSSQEGVTLMCLAESLLRIPDKENIDNLIAEKISSGNWSDHRGKSSSLFVNASVWGLMLSGSLVGIDTEAKGDTSSWIKTLTGKLSEPVLRQAIRQAMRILGQQYVLGRDIRSAIKRGASSNPEGTRFSFDMLGEGARTLKDAAQYLNAYQLAIEAIGSNKQQQHDVHIANSISVKLSALYPRYEFEKQQQVKRFLYPALKSLAVSAKKHNIGLSIDAEEADRLELNIDLFEMLLLDPDLQGWEGLGFVLQAYQKRAQFVCDWLIEFTRLQNRKILVRLVKGAYWDTEIKHAQEKGFVDYPVYTRKVNTDLSYRICARKLLGAQDCIYPQFATHNAQTIALIHVLGRGKEYEFQRLHGMGELLYRYLHEQNMAPPVRVYAPVGAHKELLPYLVRRLLENGANSSFVNRFLDDATPVEKLITDTETLVKTSAGLRHPKIPVPASLFAETRDKRTNARGVDLENEKTRQYINAAFKSVSDSSLRLKTNTINIAGSGHDQPPSSIEHQTVNVSPANPAKVVATVIEATEQEIAAALLRVSAYQHQWRKTPANDRALMLEKLADQLEHHQYELIALLALEAGRTLADGVDELREAVDFCRYYAHQARLLFSEPTQMPGPTGETNQIHYQGRGLVMCISPWNFPLAIFLGQISAALAAGNVVIAKPAEQTPVIAARTMELMYQAGIPEDAIQLLIGDGSRIGSQVMQHPGLCAVMFTGSTATAGIINKQLAGRPGAITALVAETGGLNVMIADSTAQPEQLVDDVIRSAFQSAGQRCSALRVLYVQEDVADQIIAMLTGAMDLLEIGKPEDLATDIGPVIDKDAHKMLADHIARLDCSALALGEPLTTPESGNYIAPRAYLIDSIKDIPGEIFGPVLHVIRYRQSELDQVISDINETGFGLTLGVHSRLESVAQQVFENTSVGNVYINRDVVGAVVGVNPFGGSGLSGTGPKAGGPNYLKRLVTERTLTDNKVATGGNIELFAVTE